MCLYGRLTGWPSSYFLCAKSVPWNSSVISVGNPTNKADTKRAVDKLLQDYTDRCLLTCTDHLTKRQYTSVNICLYNLFLQISCCETLMLYQSVIQQDWYKSAAKITPVTMSVHVSKHLSVESYLSTRCMLWNVNVISVTNPTSLI